MKAVNKWALGALLIAGMPLVGQALVIRGFDPVVHNRFSSGYPGNPVENPNFFQADFDFSGVGWDASNGHRSLALVSPRHFVGANHFQPAVGATLNFFNSNGELRSFTVGSIFNVRNESNEVTDLFVGELVETIGAGDALSFYSLPDFPGEAAYLGQELLVYGRSARVGLGIVDSFLTFGADPVTSGAGINDTRSYLFNYDEMGGGRHDAHGESGDSGSPSFIVMQDRLTLVGTHMGIVIGPTFVNTYDVFIPHYVDEINAIMAGAGYQLSIIPEARHLTLLLGSLAGLAVAFRQRRLRS